MVQQFTDDVYWGKGTDAMTAEHDYVKEKLIIEQKEKPLTILQDITFARVPYWFPSFHYKSLKMDLVCPFHSEEGAKYPVIIWICGGAWITMEKSAHLPFWIELARKGYLIASVEYRMSSTKHFPAQIEDVKSAIRYLRAHAEEFHVDPDRIVVGGESAGGHLAALAGATGDIKTFDVGDNLDQSSRVQAVLDFYGPASFTMKKSVSEDLEKEKTSGKVCKEEEVKPEFLMGPDPVEMLLGYKPLEHLERADQAAALFYINSKTPPYFIIHGTADPVVPVEGSRKLAQKLKDNGCSAELVEIEGAVHADPMIYQEETREQILSFLDRVFAKPSVPFFEHIRTKQEAKEPFLTMLENIEFAQTPYWFPFYNYKDLNLDLILPLEQGAEKKHPLLVWICGGAFLTMEKAAYIPWLLYFAKEGYVVASIQYRLSNVAHFPSQLEDAKKAIRFLHAHAEEFHIDKERTVVGGESAGGYLASMVGLTNGRKEFDVGEYLQESSSVDAVIDFYGPTSFLASQIGEIKVGEDDIRKGPNPLLGFAPKEQPDKAKAYSPCGNVTKGAPPFFMAHGTADVLVDSKASDVFYEQLKEQGIPVQYYLVEGAPHMGMQFYQKEMADRILKFLQKVR